MRRGTCALFLLVLTIAIGQPAFCSAAVSFTSPTIDFDNFTDLVGWEFYVNNDITIDALGFYDNPANGISLTHPIGIYDVATQGLVLSGTVGPSDPYNSWFNWANIAPTTLLAGHTYDIVTILGSDNRTWNPNGIAFDPNITYIRNVWSNGVYTLAFPCCTDTNPYGYFGPNFDIETTNPVPEPSTLLLLVPGILGAVGAIRRGLVR